MPPPRCQFHGSGDTSARGLLADAAAGSLSARSNTSAMEGSSPTLPIEATSPEAAPTPPRQAGGYGALKRGGYGKMSSDRDENQRVKKIYPKSANFQRQETGLELDDGDMKEAPQSARAAMRSWSASGGEREATFKKRPPSVRFFRPAIRPCTSLRALS